MARYACAFVLLLFSSGCGASGGRGGSAVREEWVDEERCESLATQTGAVSGCMSIDSPNRGRPTESSDDDAELWMPDVDGSDRDHSDADDPDVDDNDVDDNDVDDPVGNDSSITPDDNPY